MPLPAYWTNNTTLRYIYSQKNGHNILIYTWADRAWPVVVAHPEKCTGSATKSCVSPLIVRLPTSARSFSSPSYFRQGSARCMWYQVYHSPSVPFTMNASTTKNILKYFWRGTVSTLVQHSSTTPVRYATADFLDVSLVTSNYISIQYLAYIHVAPINRYQTASKLILEPPYLVVGSMHITSYFGS